MIQATSTLLLAELFCYDFNSCIQQKGFFKIQHGIIIGTVALVAQVRHFIIMQGVSLLVALVVVVFGSMFELTDCLKKPYELVKLCTTALFLILSNIAFGALVIPQILDATPLLYLGIFLTNQELLIYAQMLGFFINSLFARTQPSKTAQPATVYKDGISY